MNPLHESAAQFLAQALGWDLQKVLPMLETPKNLDMGDVAFPCFQLAKTQKKAPPAIAADLATQFSPNDILEAAVATGPYLNFKANTKARVVRVLTEILTRGADYGRTDAGQGRNICVDFSSPNVAKPLGVHHIRSTMIGQAICRLLEMQGYATTKINFLGDWGTNFGNLIWAYKHWGEEEALKENPTRHLVDLYQRFTKEAKENETLLNEGRGWFKKLEEGDAQARETWQQFKDASIAELKGIYERLHVSFDDYSGEAHYEPVLEETIDKVKASGILKEDDGALVVPMDGEDAPPCLLCKKDGATLYATRDLAALLDRKDRFEFSKCLYVVALQQKLHFQQLFEVVHKMGYAWAADCVHVEFGMLSFADDTGEYKRGSTRSGHILYLDDVLDAAVDRAKTLMAENGRRESLGDAFDQVAEDVGVGAVIFSDLKNSRVKDVRFSLADVVNFQGDTGPYLQYAHARIGSIIRKSPEGKVPEGADLSLLVEEPEYRLVVLLEQFPEVLARAAALYEPSVVSQYLLELAKAYSSASDKVRILVEDQHLRAARLALVGSVQTVLQTGLRCLGLATPEAM